MDINRRIATGTLSEIFGKRTIDTDKFMRKLGYSHYVHESFDFYKKNSQYQKEMNAYVAGINYFGNNFKLPLEYYLTQTNFVNFSVFDILTTITMFSFSMNNDYDIELLYQFLEREIGKDFTDFVFSFRDKNYPFWNESIINDDELIDMGLSKIKKKTKIPEENNDIINKKENKDNNEEIKEDNNDIKIIDEDDNENTKNKLDEKIIGNRMSNSGASNCWNILGKYTKS